VLAVHATGPYLIYVVLYPNVVTSSQRRSDYLSSRDQQSFESIFTAFRVSEFIRYGTFHSLCEQFINRYGSVRDLVTSKISGHASSLCCNVRLDRRPKILLVDEVDVFFSKDFYGNLYRPLARVQDPMVSDLISYVWENRNDVRSISLKQLAKTTEYANLMRQFSGCWTELPATRCRKYTF
jgi:hypothetical protein